MLNLQNLIMYMVDLKEGLQTKDVLKWTKISKREGYVGVIEFKYITGRMDLEILLVEVEL
jgi:hypothetical protein